MLGMSDVSMAMQRLDTEDKAKLNLGLRGSPANIISESGLYSLILKSRKPEARAFKKWVTSVVLPAIRKHGGYIKDEEGAATGPRGCPGKSRGPVVS